ncbi:MAG: nucleoside phosphorylase [bacterium]|nr:nucleoside phosphorylase [bacterium]
MVGAMSGGAFPLTRLKPDDVARRALVVGDPARAEKAAALLDGAEKVAENREYLTFAGTFEGHRVNVISHGIGSAGAGAAFEELIRGGARVLIRAGTCGAVQDGIADGATVIATGAVRDEGLTPRLVPLSYPAVAHHEVTAGLEAAAAEAGVTARAGVVLSSDLFYPSEVLGLDWRVWQASGVAAVEMEAAALFVIAALHGLKAGGVFTVDGNPTRAAEDMSEYDPHREVVAEGVERMLRIALSALARLDPGSSGRIPGMSRAAVGPSPPGRGNGPLRLADHCVRRR